MTQVSVGEATAFAKWAEASVDGGVVRLPTHNEWMIAAYGATRNYPWGDEWGPNAHFMGLSLEPEITESVKARPRGRTPEGLYGVWGNVNELLFSGDQVRNWLHDCGTQWMGGGYQTDNPAPRKNYWGYTHSGSRKCSDTGFRLLWAPAQDEILLATKPMFLKSKEEK